MTDRLTEAGQLSLPASEFLLMLESMESDGGLVWCEVCGAWLRHDDEALATTEDLTACWKAATGRRQDDHLCRSYRGALIDEAKMLAGRRPLQETDT